MELYYFTFGVGTCMGAYYQPIYARNEEQAYETMKDHWGREYVAGYTEKDFAFFMKNNIFKDLKELPVIYAEKIITTGEMEQLTKRLVQITSASQMLRKKRLNNMLRDIVETYKFDPFIEQLVATIQEEI